MVFQREVAAVDVVTGDTSFEIEVMVEEKAFAVADSAAMEYVQCVHTPQSSVKTSKASPPWDRRSPATVVVTF